MIAIVTDRVECLTVVEDGVTLIPTYEPLDAPDEQTRKFSALVVAVDHDTFHHPRFTAWLERAVRPHLSFVGYEYRCRVAAAKVDRPELGDSEYLFRHLPDGAVFGLDGGRMFKTRQQADFNAVDQTGGQWDVAADAVCLFDPTDESSERLSFLLAHHDPEAGGL